MARPALRAGRAPRARPLRAGRAPRARPPRAGQAPAPARTVARRRPRRPPARLRRSRSPLPPRSCRRNPPTVPCSALGLRGRIPPWWCWEQRSRTRPCPGAHRPDRKLVAPPAARHDRRSPCRDGGLLPRPSRWRDLPARKHRQSRCRKVPFPGPRQRCWHLRRSALRVRALRPCRLQQLHDRSCPPYLRHRRHRRHRRHLRHRRRPYRQLVPLWLPTRRSPLETMVPAQSKAHQSGEQKVLLRTSTGHRGPVTVHRPTSISPRRAAFRRRRRRTRCRRSDRPPSALSPPAPPPSRSSHPQHRRLGPRPRRRTQDRLVLRLRNDPCPPPAPRRRAEYRRSRWRPPAARRSGRRSCVPESVCQSLSPASEFSPG
jgi:hypothetical protein